MDFVPPVTLAPGLKPTYTRVQETGTTSQFVQRDRIQAGLSKGVAMIHSDLDGGSLHASRAALRYGRLLAVPRPTAVDIEAAQSKIRANVLLADGSDEEKMQLLQCDSSALSRVRVLTSREDYDVWERELEADG